MGGGHSHEVGGGEKGGNLEDARRRVDSAKSTRPGVVLVAATEILRVAGIAAFHTSVVLGDKEYYFDSQGIISAPALWSHFVGQSKRPQEFKTEVINCGLGFHTGLQLVQSLQSFFEKGSYDVLHKNCNIFSDAALYYLTRRRLQGRFSRLERLLVATEPFSTEVLNRLLMTDPPQDAPASGSSGRLWPGPYFVNPRAEHFSVDRVIAACDALNAAEAGGQSLDRGVCGCMLSGCIGETHALVEEAPETTVATQVADAVDVDDRGVTRAAAVLPADEPDDRFPEEGPRAPLSSENIFEDIQYWDFELYEDKASDEVENVAPPPRRSHPMHEKTVAEAWTADLPTQEPLRDIGNQPRRCPTWSAKKPPPRGKSLDGALILEDLALPAETPRGPSGAKRPAGVGRFRRSKAVAT